MRYYVFSIIELRTTSRFFFAESAVSLLTELYFKAWPYFVIKLCERHTSFFYHDATAPCGPRPPHYRGFTITLRHTTLGGTPLYEWSARHRDLHLIHNTHKRQTSMPPAGFEPTIPASERPHTQALDRAATGIVEHHHCSPRIVVEWFCPLFGIQGVRILHLCPKTVYPENLHGFR